jgi:hypothetical protein
MDARPKKGSQALKKTRKGGRSRDFQRLKKNIMRGKSLPVSRELARIIREGSRLEGHHTLNEHMGR